MSKRLATGELAEVHPFIFTWGLLVGVSDDPFNWYRTRFCYPTRADAVEALGAWDGNGDPPGPWIKEKGRVERANPNGGDAP